MRKLFVLESFLLLFLTVPGSTADSPAATLAFTTVPLGVLTVTSYRPVVEQTDSSPYHTSTGEKVRAGGCAISRDLLCGACRRLHQRCARPDNPTKLHYGEWLFVQQYGFRQINDVMGAYSTQRVNGKKVRFVIERHVDLFVERWSEEHSVGVRHLPVFEVKEATR